MIIGGIMISRQGATYDTLQLTGRGPMQSGALFNVSSTHAGVILRIPLSPLRLLQPETRLGRRLGKCATYAGLRLRMSVVQSSTSVLRSETGNYDRVAAATL